MSESFALWTAAEAVAATGGRSTGDWVANGISIDSRTIAFGDLFVALKGPHFDGHDYVVNAFKGGATAAMVAHMQDSGPEGAPLLVVGDTLEGLNRLAAAARQRAAARVIAVTGSVGKTGTKEALRHCLGQQGPTHASTGSFNNLWGVPLSLARMPVETAFAVFEIGMNHPGEITPLTRLARPHVAIITNIEAVHAEFFPSLHAIADAKAEIFLGLEPGGTAVLNRDNALYDHLAERARECSVAHVFSFGSHPQADARVVNVALHPTMSCVSAEILGEPITYKIGIAGRHWVTNSLAVLLAARIVDADLGLAGLALANLAPPKGRGARHRIETRGGRFEMIDDSYNASPVSMRAAFEVLAAAEPGPRGRRIAILGDMLELGTEAAALHAALAEDVARLPIDLVFTAGPLMKNLHDALPAGRRGGHAADAGELAATAPSVVRAGDVVLIKGSRGSRLDRVVDALLLRQPAPLPANG